MDDRPVLELENVWKIYGTEVQVEALKGVNLKFQRGEFTAVVGPSGSGKSTLMNVMGCLDRPTRGDVIIDGVETSELSEEELAETRGKKIGFVFQQFNLLPRMNALKNVELPLSFQAVGRGERRERATEVLEKVGLGQRLDHNPPEMSGGEQQRVAIARALVTNPAMLLADEPTGNLDTKTGEGIMSIFEDLHEEGRTVIMVTHEHHIAGYAERTVQLRDGKIIAKGEKEFLAPKVEG